MSRTSSIGERVRWASKFFTHGRKIASLTPSSRWLSRAMCRDIDASRPQVILELGAGMGPVTDVIRRSMHPKSTLIALEIEPELHAITARRCPDVDVVLGSAADLDGILDERGLDSVDCVLSCLPTPSLPKEVNQSVLEFWSRRCTSEVFTQITQIPWYYRRMYRQAFQDVEFQLVVRNIPPAGVYHCSNLRADYASSDRLYGA
ncbi:MAG: hypothetical protein QF733_03040 [Phycisphaerales bacterium]|jgi:phosphatidylethanolamine/phosphatidyl-N-methylethanolamine N-methyltransferase|nr:hypothetical protein [Phycisphaerales bacterium]